MKSEFNLEANQQEIIEALDFVDCSLLTYNDWLRVGTALKTANLDFEVWNNWSTKDSKRYNASEMLKKWDSLKAGTVNAGTIIYLAKQNGYKPRSHFVKNENTNSYELDEAMMKQIEIENYNKQLEEWNNQDNMESQKKNHDILEYCETNLETSEPVKDYLSSRSISLDTARQYHLGATTYSNEEMLVIPNENGYMKRFLNDSHNVRYFKEGNGLFNAEVLTEDNKAPIFVTEGQIDALSIIQEGYKALALCSTTNKALFVNAVKMIEDIAPIVLCLDNDKTGEETTKGLERELQAYKLYKLDIPMEHKDINEWYIKDKATLKKALNEAYEKYRVLTKEEELERYLTNETPLGQIGNLFCEEDYKEPVSTGFTELDKYLEGGLYGELYTLGAGSGEGKTAFSLQIMDTIAKADNDVIIISLEMSTKETIARSLSRLTYDISTSVNSVNSTAYAKTEVGISNMNRYKSYSKNELEVIDKAREEYKAYASHIHIIEGVGNIGVSEVRAIIERHIKLTGNTPVVLIDYLQLLAPIDMRSTDKQNTDKNILELKRMTRDYNVPILLVSSLNRESYKQDKKQNITMASFKESGAIEYTSTVVIGLGMEEDDKETNTRDIKLTILKNRKGRKGTINFKYHYLFGKYEENRARNMNSNLKEKRTNMKVY